MVKLIAGGEAQACPAVSVLTDEHIDAIYYSPLPRARQSADIVADLRGLAVDLDRRLVMFGPVSMIEPVPST